MPDHGTHDQDEHDFQALTVEPARHPSIELLRAAGEGVLPPDVEARVATHLHSCALCSMLMQDLATLPEPVLTQAQTERIASSLPGRPRARRFPWAAFTAFAAMLLVAAVSYQIGPHLRHSAAKADSAAASATPTTNDSAVATLNIPLVPLLPPADDLARLQTRGGTAASPSTEDLLPAFAAYRRADYPRAAAAFTSLAKRYPSNAMIPLYLGVTQLLNAQESAAYTSLTQARRLDPHSSAAQWYTSIAAQHLDPRQSWSLLQALCAGPESIYSAESCRLVARANGSTKK